MGVRVASAVLAISTISLASALSSASAQERLPKIQVISNTPMQGSGIDKDKIASMTSSVTADDFQRSYSQNVIDTLFQRVPGVTLSDPGPVPHRQRQRHHYAGQLHPGPRLLSERAANPSQGRRTVCRIQISALARLCRLQLYRCDLSLQRHPRLAEQSVGMPMAISSSYRAIVSPVFRSNNSRPARSI